MEIEERGSAEESEGEESEVPVSVRKRRLKKPMNYKALTLGPAVKEEAVLRVPFDIYYTVSDSNERVAWKPPSCHKVGPLCCMPAYFLSWIYCLICFSN